MKASKKSTGSGFVIEHEGEKKIITNAHVIANAKFVTLRKFGSAEKYPAEIMCVAHDCDLALLTVKEESFWENLDPLPFGGIPHLQEPCQLVGFPTGGDTVSITRGIVSRVEPQPYAHGNGNNHLLAIQVDAAINPGNSGGPAILNQKVIGVAFQNLMGASNVGYIIPVPIIFHFLDDVARNGYGGYRGFGALGIHYQYLENPSFRSYLKMPPSKSGIVINEINPLSHAFSILRKDDVIMSIDDIPIANDASVPFRGRERIGFEYLFSRKFLGDQVKLKLLRNGEEREEMVEISKVDPLVPVHSFDKAPSYYILAGMVFINLTQSYLFEWGDDWRGCPRQLVSLALDGIKHFPDEEVIVLSQILSNEINRGFNDLVGLQVKSINGSPVRNLRSLVDIIELSFSSPSSSSPSPSPTDSPVDLSSSSSKEVSSADSSSYFRFDLDFNWFVLHNLLITNNIK